MQLTRIAFAFSAAQSVAISGNPAVERSPEQHAAGEIHHWHGPPESAESPGEIANCCRSPMAFAAGVDDAHFLH